MPQFVYQSNTASAYDLWPCILTYMALYTSKDTYEINMHSQLILPMQSICNTLS